MARIQTHPILSQLRAARSCSEQASALRLVKNEIVGHDQKKGRWVELGVLDPLVRVLTSNRSSPKVNGKESRSHGSHTRHLSEEEAVRLQALQVLASFAIGGTEFLAPMHAAGAVQAILANVIPTENPPQVVLMALRCLYNIADSASLSVGNGESLDSSKLAEILFAPRYMDPINSILNSGLPGSDAQDQIALVARLISHLCRDDQHQNALANAGVLDALATILASFVVAQGQVVPGADAIGQADGLADMIPDPAPPEADLTVILEAISAIIGDSRFRACLLLYSPAILAIFPATEFLPPPRDARTAWTAMEMAGLASTRTPRPSALDYLLPVVPVHPSKALASQTSSHFPPLGFSLAKEPAGWSGKSPLSKSSGWDPSRLDAAGSNTDADVEEPESPLIPWLIHQVSTSNGMERIMAASILASLYKAGFVSPAREHAIGVLVVPPLLHWLESLVSPLNGSDSKHAGEVVALRWATIERTPLILARFVADSELLQKAAYDCGAVKIICKLLKDSYEPFPASSASRMWSPAPDGASPRDYTGSSSPSCRLGPHGQLPIRAHRPKLRESALKALAAMISLNEEYRKAFVEQDIVPYVVESLSEMPSKPRSNKERSKAEAGQDDASAGDVAVSRYGVNPVPVIVSACHIVRMLSRSVSVLRTSLEDHGVALPLFRLLRHPDVDVQIAACGAVCNVVVTFSPMRERFIDAGVVQILCLKAHSVKAGLRLNAVWALKHLVESAGTDMKRSCLDQLEPGWLVQLICDDTEDEALFTRAKAERRLSMDDMDEDMDMDAYEEDSRPWLWSGMYRSSTARSTSDRTHSPRMQRAERRLAALREAELNPVRKARSDDLAIQEQGLDFIRNLMSPPAATAGAADCAHGTTEMIDYVFSEIGQDRLFEILAAKLRVKVLHPFSRRLSGTRAESRVLYPQGRVVVAVAWILVHMAASVPRHRQLVVAQTELLRALGHHFASRDKDVRVALCHLVANLVWQDDGDDAQACAGRALELRRLGFLGKLETLEAEDGELDVRERAKSAVWQIKQTNL